MFGWWKERKKKKEEDTMATIDEKEIKKAEEDIEKKGPDSQTERGRIDESVAAQERASGDEDSQSAKDRVNESEGAKRADEKREEKEDGFARLEAKLDKLMDMLGLIEKLADEGEGAGEGAKDEKALENAREKYGLGSAAFEAKEQADKITAKEAADILKLLKP